MNSYDRIAAFRRRQRRTAIIRAVALWAGLIVLCLLTLLGLWTFFFLLFSLGAP